ncbi:MAG TPA: alpha/beta fold hydrolase [Tepidisphaeraceae bacterium]|jgi:pimeloyl-ACP methyl ester carboxylesterase
MTSPPAATDAATGFPGVVVGKGPPLVLFPGMSRRPETRQLPYAGLARITNRRVYVLNRPAGLHRGLTMRDLAARHADALAERFADPVDLIGISTGGAIALQLAADHPGRVNRLIIAAAASWLGDEGRSKLRRYADEIARGRSGAMVLASVLAPRGGEWLMVPMHWVAHQFEKRWDPNDLLATIDAEAGFDVTPRLGEIRSPTLLIAGGRDRAFPPELVRATAAGIPGSRLIVYPKAGHLGTMMNRHFGRDVAGFLATSHPPEPGDAAGAPAS